MAEAVLAVDGLTKRYGALTACDGVTLDLRVGEIHALIGPNGAGKSTLIKLIAGETAPDEGVVRFDGYDVTSLSAAERARAGLGRTFQVSALVNEFTVLQNVVLAAIGASGKLGFWRRAMKERALHDRAMAQVERLGLAARRDVRVGDLSHGERRQLEIALATVLEPKAFLLDEPMAGIGPGGSHELTKLLSDLRHEAPILLVEHDMDAVFALADRVSVLVYGRIVAQGSVAEIRNDPIVREAYLGTAA